MNKETLQLLSVVAMCVVLLPGLARRKMCDTAIPAVSSSAGRKESASLDVIRDRVSSKNSLAQMPFCRRPESEVSAHVCLKLFLHKCWIFRTADVALDRRVLERQIVVNSGSKLKKLVQQVRHSGVSSCLPLWESHMGRKQGRAGKVFLKVAA
ncbi:hypothetical protein ILYODFUR_009059 [Ilyodon furcidens]|uniref:Secreted protein n=1 Tax=Ilyodon furcidens TaxID=33524 RepID=A0ABV0U499_9TELE